MNVNPDLKEKSIKFKNTERDNRKTRREVPKVMSGPGRVDSHRTHVAIHTNLFPSLEGRFICFIPPETSPSLNPQI